MTSLIEMRMHGRGGQGVVTLAELLAKAALKKGWEVQTLPFFGVERRGAAVKATVRFDESPIKVRSMSYQPDILVLLHENLLPIGLADGVAPHAQLVVNGLEPLASDYSQWLVDAVGIALKHDLVIGGEPFINVPMLGALGKILEIPLELIQETISEYWPPKKAAPNLLAAAEAFAAVSKVKGGPVHA